jgi:hypothetical protein
MIPQLKRHRAKLTLDVMPKKIGNAWFIKTPTGEHWIPDTFVSEFNPLNKSITIDTWILDKKGIKYKL